jgi:DNA-binding GntR family transcriptional regulator
MLEQEGLAVIVPRRGAQVAKMTEKDLQDVLEIRDALDELAAFSACKKITPEAIAELRETMTSFKEAAERGDVREVAMADEKFHSIIYKAADNPKLMVIIQNLKEQMYRYRYEYVKDNANYQRILEEHEAIIRGFEKKDSDYVKKMMHAHLENQVEAVRDVIRHQED